jgi:hypothetical protein
VRHEASDLGLQIEASSQPVSFKTAARSRKRHWLLRIPGSRKVFVTIYNRLFEILYR